MKRSVFQASRVLANQLENELQCQLRLQGIAYALAQEAIEVEEPRCYQRVDIVFVVEAVEHLDHRNQRIAIAEVERPYGAPIEGEEAVVFAQVIAAAVDAADHSRQRIVWTAGSGGAGTERAVV